MFLNYHQEKEDDVTISVIEVDRGQASSFGVVDVDPEFAIRGFQEKPADPPAIPGDPEHSLASMGIYLFKKEVLLEVLEKGGGSRLWPRCDPPPCWGATG